MECKSPHSAQGGSPDNIAIDLGSKHSALAMGLPPVDEEDVERRLQWDIAERRAERKLLVRLLPCMFLFSLINYIDRSNLAFAASSLERDLGFNNAVFGLAAGVFFATYASLQIPSQLLATRLGGPRMLSLLAISWGLIASSAAAVKTEAGLIAQRVFLGAAEAGALPAMWMVNSQWFPTHHLTIPSTCVMMAITVAQAISAPLASGLLKLEGHFGPLWGWQAMFLLEGIPAIILGIAIGLFMPRSVGDAKFLTEEEKAAWQAAIDETDSSSKHGPEGDWAALKSAMTSRVVYCAGIWRGFYATALYGILYFSPLIIRSIMGGHAGQDDSKAALLTAVPFVLGACTHAANALHSTRTGERRVHIAVPWILGGVLMALVPACMIAGSGTAAFVLFVFASAGINSSDGPDVSWVTSLMSGKQRALGLAAVNMFANIGGFVGPYVIGALSTATGSFNGPMWFVAGCIIAAGSFVALFPVKWAAHDDMPVIKLRQASSLELRQLSRRLSHASGSRPISSVGSPRGSFAPGVVGAAAGRRGSGGGGSVEVGLAQQGTVGPA